MQRLHSAAALHLDEFGTAERDLAALLRHLSEAGPDATDFREQCVAAQAALALVVDELQSRQLENSSG